MIDHNAAIEDERGEMHSGSNNMVPGIDEK